MGSCLRRNINPGGGFRINLSKSGIGYGWGVKDVRITKTAQGRVRGTLIKGRFAYTEREW